MIQAQVKEGSFHYEACLRKLPRQQRSKDCVSHIYSSALLLTHSYPPNHLTVEVIASKSGHSGSTISEWMDLNDKALFVKCAARYHAHNILSRIKISSLAVDQNTNIAGYIDRLLDICLPADSNLQVTLYKSWQHLDVAEQDMLIYQIRSHIRSAHLRSSPQDYLKVASGLYAYLAAAVWGICHEFSKLASFNRNEMRTRPEVVELIHHIIVSTLRQKA